MTDQSDRRLGIGVIGCGNVAQFAHLPNIARNPRGRLVAVADIDEERANATSEQYGGQVYTDHQALLANPDVEMVCVTTWPLAHAQAVIDAAQAGKHILCEKPIATTLADADAMVAAADKADVKFTMGYQTRFGFAWPFIKKTIDDGMLGRIMNVNISSAAPSGLYAPWFLKKELSGGGVLMDWGIYTAFAINWWLGPVERVYATSAIFRPELMVKDQLITDLDVEDTVAAHLQFTSGAMGSWNSAWAVKAAHSVTSIDGDRGSLRTSSDTQGIHLFSTELNDDPALAGWRQIPAKEPPLGTLHYRKIEHLVDAVLDDTPLVMTGADGRDALELVLAIYHSAETGQPVDLPLNRASVLDATAAM